MEMVIIFWILCGIATAVVANNKRRSGCAWFILGMLLGPIGLFMIAFLSPVLPDAPKHNWKGGVIDIGLKKCPFCAESIKKEALKCKHCGSDLTATR